MFWLLWTFGKAVMCFVYPSSQVHWHVEEPILNLYCKSRSLSFCFGDFLFKLLFFIHAVLHYRLLSERLYVDSLTELCCFRSHLRPIGSYHGYAFEQTVSCCTVTTLCTNILVSVLYNHSTAFRRYTPHSVNTLTNTFTQSLNACC